jgi:hypothetical protein
MQSLGSKGSIEFREYLAMVDKYWRESGNALWFVVRVTSKTSNLEVAESSMLAKNKPPKNSKY